MAAQRTFLFTGGGTGGHVTPALAIAEGIRAEHPEANFVYVGVKGKAEDGMVQKAWKEHTSFMRNSPASNCGQRPNSVSGGKKTRERQIIHGC